MSAVLLRAMETHGLHVPPVLPVPCLDMLGIVAVWIAVCGVWFAMRVFGKRCPFRTVCTLARRVQCNKC